MDGNAHYVSPFVYKTYQMVTDRRTDSIVSWNAQGTALVIWNRQEFQDVILPQYFKHNKFSSFVRQLNIYDFHKITSKDTLEYSNHLFLRDDPQKLKKIQRKKTGKKVNQTPNGTVQYIPQMTPVPSKEDILKFSQQPQTGNQPRPKSTENKKEHNFSDDQRKILANLFEHQRKTEETIRRLCSEREVKN